MAESENTELLKKLIDTEQLRHLQWWCQKDGALTNHSRCTNGKPHKCVLVLEDDRLNDCVHEHLTGGGD